MSWDSNAIGAVTTARLMASPPERVYEELREYGAFQLSENLRAHVDEEMEKALVARAEPLINLGLAQYGGSPSVARLLYTQAKVGTGDHMQDKAVRLACLANQVWPQGIFSRDKVIDEEEIRRLASEGEEVSLLLTNPSQRRLIDKLFNRKPPFNDLPEDRFRDLVHCATGNPALSHDDGDEFGPDMDAWGIRNGAYELLKTAPVDQKWANVLFHLLYALGREKAPHPDSDPMIVLNRWRVLPIEKSKDDDIYAFPKGYWTQSLETGQEFLRYMAAVFGTWVEPGSQPMKINYLGSLNDQDELMRCAYYGHAKLSPKEMDSANFRDGDAFLLAALCNDQCYTNESRAKLESLMGGHVRLFYHQRCKQKNRRHKDFNPLPVSEAGKDLLDDVIEDDSANQLALQRQAPRATVETPRAEEPSGTQVVVLVGTLILGGIVRAFVISSLWNWFIAPAFHTPEMPIVTALGISALASLFITPAKYDTKGKSWKEVSGMVVGQTLLARLLRSPSDGCFMSCLPELGTDLSVASPDNRWRVRER